MCNSCFHDWLYISKKISFSIAYLYGVVSLVFCWVGFAVPDWVSYSSSDNNHKKFGLWTICTSIKQSQTVDCYNWLFSNETMPEFLKITQILITLGSGFCTFSFFIASLSLIFNKGSYKLLPVLAGILNFIAFLFIIIGINVFSEDFDTYVDALGSSVYNKRWGFWIFIPAIVFLFFSSFLYQFALFCDKVYPIENHQILLNSKTSIMEKSFPKNGMIYPVVNQNELPNLFSMHNQGYLQTKSYEMKDQNLINTSNSYSSQAQTNSVQNINVENSVIPNQFVMDQSFSGSTSVPNQIENQRSMFDKKWAWQRIKSLRKLR